MKASEAFVKLASIRSQVIGFERSKVDETKTLSQMFTAWLNLLDLYPDMRIGSMIKYNIEKDFPDAFRNNADSSGSRSRLSGVK